MKDSLRTSENSLKIGRLDCRVIFPEWIFARTNLESKKSSKTAAAKNRLNLLSAVDKLTRQGEPWNEHQKKRKENLQHVAGS